VSFPSHEQGSGLTRLSRPKPTSFFEIICAAAWKCGDERYPVTRAVGNRSGPTSSRLPESLLEVVAQDLSVQGKSQQHRLPDDNSLDAADEKNREGNNIPLRDDLAADLRDWLADKLNRLQKKALATGEAARTTGTDGEPARKFAPKFALTPCKSGQSGAIPDKMAVKEEVEPGPRPLSLRQKESTYGPSQRLGTDPDCGTWMVGRGTNC
jgi:hypothetical protein